MTDGNAPVELGELQKDEGIKLQTDSATVGDQTKVRIIEKELVQPIVPKPSLSPDEEIAQAIRESREGDRIPAGTPTTTVGTTEQPEEVSTLTERDIPSWIQVRIGQLARAVGQNVQPSTSPSPRHEIFGIKTPKRAADKGGDEAIVETPVKETHFRINDMDNEYHTTPAVKIDILSPVILGQLPTSAREAIVEDFKYLSSTRCLETGTPRLKIVQDYIERMVKGNQQWEGNIRVVIMNKGKVPRAFASPDGTIFVTQSLINILDSVDEVMAIMAHEVEHLTNGTTLAKFRSERLRGSSIGVGWLHEMASDFGGSDLLEKVGLNSVAPKDLFIKLRDYYGGIRDKEHQDLTIRAIEIYGKHYVQDSKTSHLPYIPLVPELKQDFIMTNLEAIQDAATKGDIESVELYLNKLHPKDFGEFYHIVDKAQINIDWDKKVEIANKVKALVTRRLLLEGYTDKEVKLFFSSNTENLLSPQYKNIVEIQDYLVSAEELYQKDFFNKASLKIFDEENHGDPLFGLVSRVSNNYKEMLFDESTKLWVGVEHVVKFIETVNALTRGKLRKVWDGGFINENGAPVEEWSYWPKCIMNREEKIHERLKNIMFKYIEKAYLSRDPNSWHDKWLDINQIEDFFQKIKDTGFEPLTMYVKYRFPIDQDICNLTNRQILESAHSKIFGIDIVKSEIVKKQVEFFTPEEYMKKLKGGSYNWVSQLNDLACDYGFDEETTVKYVQVGLDYIKQFNYFDKCLENLVELEIGHDKWLNRFWSRTTIDDLIKTYGLNREALCEKARIRGESNRTFDQIDFVINTMTWSGKKFSSFGDEDPGSDSRRIYDLFIKRATFWEKKFFGFVESIMQDAKLDTKTLDQYELTYVCQSLIKLADKQNGALYGVEDMERFYRLLFIQELKAKIENVHFDNIQDLRKYIKETDEKYNHIFSPNSQTEIPIYEDDVASVILFKSIRDEIHKLTVPGSLQRRDYPDMIKLLNERFPSSPQKRELIRTMQIDYINDPAIDIHDKIKFYFDGYKLLGIEGASLVAEQITDIPTWQIFKNQFDALEKSYLSGQESIDALALTDFATSMLTKQADHLIKTVSASQEASKEVSTEWAINWINTYMPGSYDEKTGKFILGGSKRHTFASFADAISFFKELPKDKKFTIALKALADKEGLLQSEGGRNLLEKMVIEGLELKDEFFSQILVGIINSGTPEVVSIPVAQMLTPIMFRALNTNAVDMVMIGQFWGSDYKEIKDRDYFQELPKILGSGTREIRDFGFRYRHQPNSAMTQLAKESSLIYLDTLDNISQQVMHSPGKDKLVESHLAPATEAMIRAGETSPLFVRGMQMAVQIKEFEPAVRERLSQTQDSTRGMDKLRFWANLLDKADLNKPGGDVQLERFLREDLISLDSYLGGGSLFTTYGATIRGTDGSPRAVVIKMLNPNAKLFIKEAYELSTRTLEGVEQNNTGKTRQDARFARSLVDLSNTWCVQDIDDPNYVGRDEAFRATIEAFNKEKGKVVISAPKNIYTSIKVKIEDQSTGITLNQFLEDKEVPAERKREAVEDLLALFDFQFEYSPASPQGKRTFYFHSDPHTGNYMIDPESPEMRLDAIDRSMYLSLEQRDVEMFKLLKDGQGVQFVDKFIKRCLELPVNNIQGSEAQRIYGLTAIKLAREKAKQFLQRKSGKTDNSAFLQIIMQEFSSYGETEGKKTIEVPLEYRLMIRNIVAMQNLRASWAS